nr:MAG TPA: hypothetical protein [Bacteriophage sp.]
MQANAYSEYLYSTRGHLTIGKSHPLSFRLTQ